MPHQIIHPFVGTGVGDIETDGPKEGWIVTEGVGRSVIKMLGLDEKKKESLKEVEGSDGGELIGIN